METEGMTFSEWYALRCTTIDTMKRFVEQPAVLDGNLLSQRIDKLNSYLSSGLEIQAEITTMYDYYFGTAIQTLTEEGKYSGNQLSAVAKSQTAKIKRVLMEVSGITKAISSAVKSTVSMLSYQKELYHDNNKGGQF